VPVIRPGLFPLRVFHDPDVASILVGAMLKQKAAPTPFDNP